MGGRFPTRSAGPRVIVTDDDAVGMLEILYSGAFTKELRVRDDLQTGVRPPLEQDALNLVAGPDWHGRFGNNDGVCGKEWRDLAYGVINEARIGIAVAAARWCADCDEHDLSLGDRGRLGGELASLAPSSTLACPVR